MTFYFNKGYDFLLTTLIDISSDGKTMTFDFGSNAEMDRKLLQTDKINCTSSKDKVKIQFILSGVDGFSPRVSNMYDLPMHNGKLHHRVGCQFIKLPGPAITLIQRYIAHTERARKALAP